MTQTLSQTKTLKERFEEEVAKNFEAFQALDDAFYREHHGRCALMKDAKVVEVFSSWQDARAAAMLLYKGEPFSLQEVTRTPLDFGFQGNVLF